MKETDISSLVCTIAPVQDVHGWRVGRLVDPFGFHFWRLVFNIKSRQPHCHDCEYCT